MPVSQQTVTVRPRDLDFSGPHLLWPGAPDPALLASLRAYGQTTPLLVDFGPQKPVLVAGLKRALALTALRLPALALGFSPEPGQDPALAYACAYLATNQAQPADDARLVRAARFFTLRGGFETFAGMGAPHLGLTPKDRRLEHLRAWSALPDWLDGRPADDRQDRTRASAGAAPGGANNPPAQLAVHELLAPLALAPRLAALAQADLAALRPFLEAVRFSKNHLDNLLTWLGEAALAAGTTLADLLARPALRETLEAGLSPGDTLQRLAQTARALRTPRLVELEGRFARQAKALTAGTRFKIQPSPGFETDAVRLEVTLTGRKDLARAAKDLEILRLRPQWDDLWDAAKPEGA